jgi:hypothetical protein
MPRQRAPVKVNQFIGGLNTEANPLSFPDNATFDERNMELNRDGSRVRRNGFDLELFHETVDTNISLQQGANLARTQFRWENPGGITGKQFIVVQIGNYVAVHDISLVPVSSPPIFSKVFNDASYTNVFGYASVDGLLVIGTGQPDLTVLSFLGGSITETTGELLIRDFFGVEATDGTSILTEYQNLQKRPTTATQEHIYNLRNQTFALPKVTGRADTTAATDPLVQFRDVTINPSRFWPSNSDNLNYHLNADPNLASNRTVERFNAASMFNTPPNTTKAPSGYFVINALKRGASRLQQVQKLYLENPLLTSPIVSLPADTTPDGATVLTEYSGRVWYAGFSGQVLNGDKESPSLSSYVLFSQVVKNTAQIFNCFQSGDPTSSIEPDLIDTDGGFIKIDGAYGIKGLMSVETSLFVFAENGIWQITGIDENGFTATGFSVSKLSEEGCASSTSIVATGPAIIYWGVNGIFAITKDRFGSWGVASISEDTIQSFYDSITTPERVSCVGYYDSLSNSARWVYGYFGNGEMSKELILNTKFQAFTLNSVNSPQDNLGILSISGGQKVTLPSNPLVTVQGDIVTSGGQDVFIIFDSLQRDPSESFYCVLLETSPTLKYTFGGYRREDTTNDWVSIEAIDSPAYLITGNSTGGDGRVRKNVPYLSVHFKQVGNEDLESLNSSCLISSQWNWTTSSGQGKFSSPRQAYRPSRIDDGNFLVQTRNKIRGSGRSVAFKFESEPNKTMHLFGWEFDMEATTDE